MQHSRIVRDTYKKFNFNSKKEIKGSHLSKVQRKFVCDETVKMLNRQPYFQLGAITVQKEMVRAHIRTDGNIIYNYMMRLALLDKIDTQITCKLTRDNRSVKVASGNSCIDYLKLTLAFDYSSDTILTDNPQHSHNDEGLIFIDWITNAIWSHYEDNRSDGFNILTTHLRNQTLFF